MKRTSTRLHYHLMRSRVPTNGAVLTDFADVIIRTPPSPRGASRLSLGKGDRDASPAFVNGGQLKLDTMVEVERVRIEDVIGRAGNGRPNLDPRTDTEFLTLNARAVEFIAKPGKIRQLQSCIRQSVLSLLKECDEFSSAVVLTSHREPRLAVVLTFWTSEAAARHNRWEEAAEIRNLVRPLIDVCCKVQTYEAALPNSREVDEGSANGEAC